MEWLMSQQGEEHNSSPSSSSVSASELSPSASLHIPLSTRTSPVFYSTSNPARSSSSFSTPQIKRHRALQKDRQARGKTVNGTSTTMEATLKEKEIKLWEDEAWKQRSERRTAIKQLGEGWRGSSITLDALLARAAAENEEEIRKEEEEKWESWEGKERRAWAAAVLAHEDRVMEEADRRGDSMAGTRYHFMKIMTGFEDEETLETRPQP